MDLARLRWLCRRGMKELDWLLLAYLDRVYPTATGAEQAVFQRLLDESDAALWQYLTDGPPPEDPELAALVRSIRHTAASRS